MVAAYPERGAERNRWVLAQRGARRAVDPFRPYAFFLEQEPDANGAIVSIATIFLTNRECPWRCVMCDLWENTTTETVPVGALPAQIDFALSRLPPARQIKLYNSGSFFDASAVPIADHPAIAQRVKDYERVIVECHPKLIGPACVSFAGRLHGQLEIAMGLETVHPEILPRLNKGMTLPQFSNAAAFLARERLALRAFILVQPPFMKSPDAVPWARKSLDFAFACGATVASLIPTRQTQALQTLSEAGDFTQPSIEALERSQEYGVALRHGRVFADLWDLEKFSRCPVCLPGRRERMGLINLRQTILPPITCGTCGAGARV